MLTRTSSGLIDPALAGTTSQSQSHESSSSSFSSPRPLNSIDDIESLRDIFYRPSPDPRVASLAPQDGEHALDEEDEDDSSDGAGAEREDWTFGRRPIERVSELRAKAPLVISIAPGTPGTPPLVSATYRDVPESVHDSDSASERSVGTTSSQRATNGERFPAVPHNPKLTDSTRGTENVTFGVVPSAQVDALSLNVASRRQSTALSLIDMYEYERSISSGAPTTPQNRQIFPSPFARASALHAAAAADRYPRESYYTTSSAATGPRPGMDHLISGFPTPPLEAVPMSATVLSSYFDVDDQSLSRRETDGA
jgi:hypothetical protein